VHPPAPDFLLTLAPVETSALLCGHPCGSFQTRPCRKAGRGRCLRPRLPGTEYLALCVASAEVPLRLQFLEAFGHILAERLLPSVYLSVCLPI